MTKQFKKLARLVVLFVASAVLVSALPGCAAQKCDCPTFGGHKLRH